MASNCHARGEVLRFAFDFDREVRDLFSAAQFDRVHVPADFGPELPLMYRLETKYAMLCSVSITGVPVMPRCGSRSVHSIWCFHCVHGRAELLLPSSSAPGDGVQAVDPVVLGHHQQRPVRDQRLGIDLTLEGGLEDLLEAAAAQQRRV